VAIRVEVPEGEDALTEFVRFHDDVYADRGARWPALVPFQLPILTGDSPFVEDRTFRPFLVRDGAEIVARVVAVLDERYRRHWNERIGHLVMFEARPGTREATRVLMDAACEWLAANGAEAARAGFGVLEFPFVIDDYESLPPSIVRQNPPYYHSLFKDAGFESEQGWVDYKMEARPELVARWESAIAAAERGGYRLVPLAEIPPARRSEEFVTLWNHSFRRHWGFTPFSRSEASLLFDAFAVGGVLDASMMAYRGDDPVGTVWVAPESTGMALLGPGRRLAEAEKLNFLGIGVHESARGRGINLAMASKAFLELLRRGATWVSYTLVLDDNWPSRRTAEKLGAEVCASYLVYRRNFRRR
jgi:GNAT superfamily N-acetyltransferase